MHIPDGFLDARTALTSAALSAVGVGIAARALRKTFPRRRVPLVGLAAAFIFAAQMLNFPVLGGTSGHLIGAVLAAVLLGPHAAVVVMSSVLVLQCLLFADGGVTALGANLFNMAILAPNVGYGIYRLVRRIAPQSLRARLLATAFAAWCSTVVAAMACTGQLALSGVVSFRVAFPAMTGIHMLIGAGEAVITTLVVAAVLRSRPELLSEDLQPGLQPRRREAVGYGLLLSVGLAVFVTPFACPWPDGLERVAASLGFEHRATSAAGAPLAEYHFPWLGDSIYSTMLAGAVGLLIAFALAYGLARRLTPEPSINVQSDVKTTN
jgi:cobalt/nickel transport system permease protein